MLLVDVFAVLKRNLGVICKLCKLLLVNEGLPLVDQDVRVSVLKPSLLDKLKQLGIVFVLVNSVRVVRIFSTKTLLSYVTGVEFRNLFVVEFVPFLTLAILDVRKVMT